MPHVSCLAAPSDARQWLYMEEVKSTTELSRSTLFIEGGVISTIFKKDSFRKGNAGRSTPTVATETGASSGLGVWLILFLVMKAISLHPWH